MSELGRHLAARREVRRLWPRRTWWRALFAAGAVLLATGSGVADPREVGTATLETEFQRELDAGRFASALARGRLLLEAAQAQQLPDRSRIALLHEDLARTQLGLGDFTAAETHLLHVLEPASVESDFDLKRAKTLNLLGRILTGHRRFTEAETRFRALILQLTTRFPESHQEIASNLFDLGNLYRDWHKYGEAEANLMQALSIREAHFPAGHADLASSLNAIGNLNWVRGRYPQARTYYERALKIRDIPAAADHPDLATILSNYGATLVELGQFHSSLPHYARALAIRERALGPMNYAVSIVLNNVSNAYRELGRLKDAELALRRALIVRESNVGPNDPAIATLLNNLALVYVSMERDAEVEAVYRRAEALLEGRDDAGQRGLGQIRTNLGRLYLRMGRAEEARSALKSALAISVKARGEQHHEVATALNHLALAEIELGRNRNALTYLQRGLDIRRSALGERNTHTALTHNRMAEALQRAGDLDEAERLLRHGLSIQLETLGPSHPNTAIAYRQIGSLLLEKNATAEALEVLAKAVSLQRKWSGIVQRRPVTLDGGDDHRMAFTDYIRAGWRRSREAGADADALANDAFLSAQWSGRTAVAAALAQMGARVAAGTGQLAQLIRQAQDMSDHYVAVNRRFIAAVGVAAERQNRERINALRDELDQAQAGLAEINRRVEAEFPQYAGLANPEPLSLAATQRWLRADEALMLLTDLSKHHGIQEETFAWLITSTKVRWARLPSGTFALTEQVQSLRCGLDAEEWEGIERPARCRRLLGVTSRPRLEDPLPFDLGIAHRLYRELFGPFEDLIDGKHLLIVPSGPLTSLPFQVLVTEHPPASRPSTFAGYQGIAWLGRRQPLTVLPSVASLQGLRKITEANPARRAYIGYGNPELDGDGGCRPSAPRQSCAGLPGFTNPFVEKAARRDRPDRRSGGVERIVRNSFGSASVLAEVKALCPLPDTEHELRCVAKSLGLQQSELRLGADASEANIKQLSESNQLAEFRILHFATHGLVSGSIDAMGSGQGEPALVMTPPRQPVNADDDGLLTASEVAQLRLNADWVILSACNTAAGNSLGAEALSGLARAFFYAGARAVLVSHWPVYSDAAAELLGKIFDEMQRNPAIGRSDSLRRSMIALMDDTSQNDNSHPSVWAPFVVVGEGAVDRQ